MVYDPTVPFWDLLTAPQWRPVALQWNPPRSSGSRGAIRFLGFFFWPDLFNTLLISEPERDFSLVRDDQFQFVFFVSGKRQCPLLAFVLYV